MLTISFSWISGAHIPEVHTPRNDIHRVSIDFMDDTMRD